ncbi:hypothetical protein ACLXNF_17195 [Mycobacteroides chelonae]|uniref:hypothetical protein n=1 Tax=Mycobacteroides chelonae TaxID=1774 RepID=UPI0039E7A3E0
MPHRSHARLGLRHPAPDSPNPAPVTETPVDPAQALDAWRREQAARWGTETAPQRP